MIIVTISTFRIGYTIQQAVDLTVPAAIALVLRHAFNTWSVLRTITHCWSSLKAFEKG